MSFSEDYSENKSTHYGRDTLRLINNFLRTTEHFKLTSYTLTEMFAFVYFEIDRTMYIRKLSSREKISKDIILAYESVIKKNLTMERASKCFKVFDSRLNEYAKMFSQGKEPFDVIERFDFYMNQSSNTDEFFNKDSGVFVGDVYDLFDNKIALADFYVHSIIPFVMSIINNEL